MATEEKPKPASLQDMLSYQVETHLTEEEGALIRNVFGGPQGAKVLKVVRKIFLPTTNDPELPAEEFGKDMFMSQFDFKMMEAEEVKPIILGMQLTMKAVMGGIIKLKTIANTKSETPAEAEARKAADSTR